MLVRLGRRAYGLAVGAEGGAVGGRGRPWQRQRGAGWLQACMVHSHGSTMNRLASLCG